MRPQAIDFLGRPVALAVGLGVAGFLVLYWVVRGAPIGQSTAEEPSEAPRSADRDRVVALAVVGFLLILAGAAMAATFSILASLPAFAAGIGIVLWVLSANRKYRHVSPTIRRVLGFSNTVLTATLLGGILVVGNVAAFRYGGRPIDFTRDEAFSLSTLSINGVKALERPVRFTLVLGRSPRSGRLRDRIRQLVDLYRAANPEKVEVEEVTAFGQSQAAAFDALVKRVPDLNVVQGDAIVVEEGEGASADRAVIAVADLFRDAGGGPPGAERSATAFGGEDAITSTLARFREGKRSQVGFTTGHGEPSIQEMDPRQVGIGLWRSRLSSVGTDSVEVNLIRDDVPDSVSLMIVVAPRTKFQDQEVGRLKSFLARGRPLLVLMNGLDRAGLDEVLALHNVGFDPGLIVDPSYNLGGRTDLVITPPIPSTPHPIVESLAGQSVLLPGASPIRIVGGAPGRPGEPRPSTNPAMVVYPFLRTSSASWSETDLDGKRPELDRTADLPGPLIVGVEASERPEVAGGKSRPRLVLLSSGLMALNPYLEIFPYNTDILMNAIQWLRDKPESLGVAPKIHTAVVFTADPNLRFRLHAVPTVISVVLILGFGITIYLARRS